MTEELPREPVWLVRAVLLLFLVGFAAFLGREVQRVADGGFTASQIGWVVGAMVALGITIGVWAGRALSRRRTRQ